MRPGSGASSPRKLARNDASLFVSSQNWHEKQVLCQKNPLSQPGSRLDFQSECIVILVNRQGDNAARFDGKRKATMVLLTVRARGLSLPDLVGGPNQGTAFRRTAPCLSTMVWERL